MDKNGLTEISNTDTLKTPRCTSSTRLTIS